MRCNAGVNPIYLADQHLIAEYREIPMLIGSLQYWKWEIKSIIPDTFNLGAGHMNFLKTRLKYAQRRHQAVIEEMKRRGFKCDLLSIDLTEIPDQFCNDWQPTFRDSLVIRKRITDKLMARFEKSPTFWKYERKTLDKSAIYQMVFNIDTEVLFYV